jgi:hypothetical protein
MMMMCGDDDDDDVEWRLMILPDAPHTAVDMWWYFVVLLLAALPEVSAGAGGARGVYPREKNKKPDDQKCASTLAWEARAARRTAREVS